ncbi:carboxylesterase [Pedobacter yulinensis]|uniref:Carboxylic ester hydrolase n=1 Tax=Pedobacter yulinensis TaxID=2126353 RepID=A0A2T3HJW2_9SPHI|nr:carboxylesterase family protein [Pedobacter yulinensis]PST82736.1 carboxylesterase [Pedobacter yulinensis]
MKQHFFMLLLVVLAQQILAQSKTAGPGGLVVGTTNGRLQGAMDGPLVRVFRGIPFAAPPLGSLRWKAPQPVKSWKGIRPATRFGPRPHQRQRYDDMIFRSPAESEDCLYLNVWAPATASGKPLPVLVYFYGGGFSSGDGSEARYDGRRLAENKVIMVTVNYRLGLFGFFVHPELTAESRFGASGNYGLLDQHAALQWVKKNIAAFGGDPGRITIGGESAGSMSVSAQVASPLSKGLFHAAIAQSGSLLGNDWLTARAKAEKYGLDFQKRAGVASLAALRRLPAARLHKLAADFWFPPVIDGYFLPEHPLQLYSTGRQLDIPLMAGWTTAERAAGAVLENAKPTVANYRKAVDRLYGPLAAGILEIYPASQDSLVERMATALASDRFIAYGTWKLIDVHSKTNGFPVYQYLFARKRTGFKGPGADYNNPFGAVHASDIEYALANLDQNTRYAWQPADQQASETWFRYLLNFLRSGNPNGTGLAEWPGLRSSIPKVMVIDSVSHALPEPHGKRYSQLDQLLHP